MDQGNQAAMESARRSEASEAATTSGIIATAVQTYEQGIGLMQALLDKARPEAVFGQPVQSGDRTVITASEAHAALGFGFGSGAGSGPADEEQEEIMVGREGAMTGEAMEQEEGYGEGGGGGGGGVSTGRPVAVIEVNPDGVEVHPIVDVTKIALALFTTIGSMAMIRARMAHKSRR